MTASESTTTASSVEGQRAEEPPKPTPPAGTAGAAGEGGAKSIDADANANEMRAIVLAAFGGLKALKVATRPQPNAPAADDELLIRVSCCGLNFQDLMVRQGAIDSLPKLPFTMGCELAGEVMAVGEKAEGGFRVGQRVCAITDMKAWAEWVSVPSKYCYAMPDGLTYQDACALVMNYTVAHALLFDVANLREGQTVLILSIGGGVGQALAQLCRLVANVTVIGTASKAKHEKIKDCCDHLVERETCYVNQVKKISESGVDLVLDCSCGEEVNKGYALLKAMGRYVLYGTSFFVSGETKNVFSFAKSWWQVDRINPMKLYDDNKTISGFNLRHLLFQQGQHEYVARKVAAVFGLLASKKIAPVVDSTWAFEDVAEAMQRMHDRKNVGKLLLDPTKPAKPVEAEKSAKESKKEKRSKDKKDTNKEDSDQRCSDSKKDVAARNEGTPNGETSDQDTESLKKT